MAGLKVALLVEHSVVREKHLVIDGLELAVVHYCRGVEGRAVVVHEPDDRR